LQLDLPMHVMLACNLSSGKVLTVALPSPRPRLPAHVPLRAVLFGRSPADRPALRGIFHQYAFVVSVLAMVAMSWLASTGQELLGVFAYCGSVSAMLATSAVYHRIAWAPMWHRHLRRADHCMIYLSMAGCYTGAWLIALPHTPLTTFVLWLAWPLAATGWLFKLVWLDAPKWISSTTYVGFGFVGLVTLPALVAGVGTTATMVFVGGGLLQLIGATIYTAGWPDPWPEHLGHHELFHLLVVVGIALQYGVLATALVA
jgi:hemolysin III